MYSHERGRISSLLKRFLHESLGLAPAISLTIFFCRVKIFFAVGCITPKNYTIFHYRVKVGEINRFESLSVADLKHTSHCIARST
jgi:hypothetical protein